MRELLKYAYDMLPDVLSVSGIIFANYLIRSKMRE